MSTTRMAWGLNHGVILILGQTIPLIVYLATLVNPTIFKRLAWIHWVGCLWVVVTASETIYSYIYAFSRRFCPKRLTVHSGYTFFFYQYVCSLGIEPRDSIFEFCASNAMLYHWATGTLYATSLVVFQKVSLLQFYLHCKTQRCYVFYGIVLFPQ